MDWNCEGSVKSDRSGARQRNGKDEHQDDEYFLCVTVRLAVKHILAVKQHGNTEDYPDRTTSGKVWTELLNGQADAVGLLNLSLAKPTHAPVTRASSRTATTFSKIVGLDFYCLAQRNDNVRKLMCQAPAVAG